MVQNQTRRTLAEYGNDVDGTVESDKLIFSCCFQYADGVVNDIDLLIIGGFYNATRTFVTRYLAGVRVNGDARPDDDIFYAACRIFSGLSVEDRKSINAKLDPHWQIVEKTGRKIGKEPGCIKWSNYPPDVWIEPSKSIVLQVNSKMFALIRI